MKSMEQIYNEMTKGSKRSMDDIYNEMVGGRDMNKIMSEANQPQALPESLTSGVDDEITGALTDWATTLGSAVGNVMGAGAKQVTNPFTGKQLPGAGYSQTGEELSATDTAKQVGGAAIEGAVNIIAPGTGKGVFQAAKYGLKGMLPKIAKGAAYGAATGFGQGFGSELRQTQDTGEAVKSGLLTSLVGAPIGGTLAGVTAKMARPVARTIEDLQTAKITNDFETVKNIESSPEYAQILKTNGFSSPQAVQDAVNDSVVTVKRMIVEDPTTMAPSKVQIRNDIRDGKYDDAIKEVLADYNAFGNNLDDAQRAREIKTKQYQTLREQIAKNLSGTEFDPFTKISSGEMKARVWESLDDTIKRDLVEGPKAQKFISDYLDEQLAKGNSMERIDFLRLSGNQDWAKTTTGAKIQTAIANASRNAIDDMIIVLERSGADPDLIKVLKDYNELNRLYGVSKQAEKLQRELGISINKKKKINRITNMLAGVGVGSATGNPFAFYAGAQLSDWGQRALNNTIEARTLQSFASKITKSSGDRITSKAPDALKRLLEKDKGIKQQRNAEKLAAQEAMKDAYLPDEQLPVIKAGPTPKSKFSKPEEGLPTIAYGAAPVTLTNIELLDPKKAPPIEQTQSREYSVPGRAVKIKENDLQELAAIMFGEIGNRSLEKQKLEARTIANIVLNRMEQKPDATATDVLTEKNQFQAYKGKEYNKYKTGEARKNPLNMNKLKAVEEVLNEIRSGKLKNNIGDAQFYAHMKDNTMRVYDTWEELKKNIKNVK